MEAVKENNADRMARRLEPLAVPGIFSVLKDKKTELIAQGMDVIDLSVGSPDMPPARHIVSALRGALADSRNFQYAITDLPELRQAAAAWYSRRFGVELDGERQITSLTGSQDGLAHICLALVDPGDIVLTPDPGYPIFHAGPELAGAQIYRVPQRPENDWVMDLREIPSPVARRAKLMIVSYPNNPTTALAPRSFYRDLVAFARDFGIMVVHDNAYCELVFEGKRGESFLSVPGAREVGVEFNSLSKTYAMAGARVGFAMGNAEMIEALSLLKSHIDYGIFPAVQKAAVAALTGPQACVARTRNAYRARRDALCESFAQAGWKIPAPQGTMFVWAKLPPGWEDSTAFSLELADRTGVLVVPGISFGGCGEGYVRMALVQDGARLREAAKRIASSGMVGK